LLGLIALGVLFFLRRRKSRTAPLAEFVYPPPQTPFSRMDSFRSVATNFSTAPPSYTTEDHNNYPQPVVKYP
jgi:hypothetical protein